MQCSSLKFFDPVGAEVVHVYARCSADALAEAKALIASTQSTAMPTADFRPIMVLSLSGVIAAALGTGADKSPSAWCAVVSRSVFD
jgi:hypothetical protein